ncbi:ABC transporter permease [Candidatus Omnitrophota bacterium]
MKVIARLSKIIAQKQVVKGMVVKNLKDKYVASALGISWALINPLLIMLAVTFVFTKIMNTDIDHFALLILSALLPWFFFVNSMCESTTSMKQNLDMLSQFVLPREIIPISVVLANFINFLFGFAVMLPLFIFFNPSIIKCLWYLPLIMLLHIIFTCGISLLFSITNVYFRDLAQLLNVGVMFLFWITPIFYPVEMIPQEFRWIIYVNPGACYIVIYKSLLYYGTRGDMAMWLLGAGFAFASLIGGYTLFIKKEREILKYI